MLNIFRITLLIFLGATLSQADNSIQRFLFVVGANNGGNSRAMLRYAANDAYTFSQVFTQMGGVKSENVVQLREPKLLEFKQGLKTLESKLNSLKGVGRSEVIIYYSGHADDKGLLLGNENYSWKELRKAVDQLPAEVKITVLDACGSGAITRLKGGQRQPAFLVDASTDMKGYAFLTSSSDDEVAQESDRIGGSYFTQSLVTGMRGAADLNGDKKVTLSEAYQFAFNETLARTQQTTGGAQHPSRDIKMSGSGDVVMTDLRETSAGLVLTKDLQGKFFIRDDRGNLVAELNKNQGKSLELGMSPGTYSVLMEQQSVFIVEAVTIKDRSRIELQKNDFKLAPRQYAVARGNKELNTMDSLRVANAGNKSEWDFNLLVSKNDKPWVGSQAALIANYSSAPMIGNQFSLLANISRVGQEGIQVTTGFNFASHLEGAQISSGANIAGYISGFQLSSGVNAADSVMGAQIGIVNIGNHIDGSQIGVLNASNRTSDYQLSVMNIAGKTGKSQIGVMNVSGSTGGHEIGVFNVNGAIDGHDVGVMNISGSTGGSQIGVFNISGSIQKHQVGVYNISGSTKGTTIGLWNIVGNAGGPVIGLLNFAGNGFWNLSLTATESNLFLSTLQVGTPYMHTNFHFTREFGSSQVQGFGWGVGTQFGMKKNWWIGLNLDQIHLFQSEDRHFWKQYGNSSAYTDNQLISLRTEYGKKIFRNLGVFGGISASCLILHDGSSMEITPVGDYHGSFETGKAYYWPGAFLGVRFGKI